MTVLERKPFSWLAGHPALDFINSRDEWAADVPRSERFRGAADLIEWGFDAGFLSREVSTALTAVTERSPVAARVVLDEGRAVRDELNDIFTALSHGVSPGDVDLHSLNWRLGAAAATLTMTWNGETHRFARCWHSEPGHPNHLFGPLLWSAAELLIGDQLDKLRVCGGDRCAWLFLDTSRNGMRRWCDMKICGNRAKSRKRHAQRTLAPPAGDGPYR